MLSLHKVSDLSHNLLKWCGVAIAGIFLLVVVIRIGAFAKELFFPTPKPLPTVSFGKLPPPSFTQSPNLKKLTYNINTLSGTLPSFPDQITIYKTTAPAPSLLALERAKERVSAVNMKNAPVQISKTIYEWNNQSLLTGLMEKLTLDILSYTFDFSTNYLSNQEIISGRGLPREDKAKEAATKFMSSISLPGDIDLGKTRTTLLTFEGTDKILASSFSQAKIIRVDFFQKDINSLPIFYPEPYHSNVHAFVTGGGFNGLIVEAHSFHQQIGLESATYPIRTTAEAFKELQNGNAYIQYSAQSPEVKINNAQLGYYFGNQHQDYLTPVFFFEGDDGFAAYVPALKDEWIEK